MRLRWLLLFLFFLTSGFCSLVDEVVWLRMAMARFGVGAPMVSTVLSVFMAGLGLGSWGGGRLATRAALGRRLSPVRLYALAELGIAASALVVPAGLDLGRALLLLVGDDATWGSLSYHVASGACVALVLLPFCFCMGATLPLGMAVLRESGGRFAERSFSYLYVANVLGATCGTLAAAFVLVELWGFVGTLRVAALLNVAIALAAWLLGRERVPSGDVQRRVALGPSSLPRQAPARPVLLLAMLFSTGLVSMAMEVVWIRQFTPYVGAVVYAFATILGLYLAATFLGSAAYRGWARNGRDAAHGADLGYVWVAAGLFGLLPLVAADPRLPLHAVHPTSPEPGDLLVGAARVTIGIALFCGMAGFLTPRLVDRYAAGDPDRGGRAYAVNVLGCIAGPLLASFVLLPNFGERWSLALLALPLFALAPAAGARIAGVGVARRLTALPFFLGGSLLLAGLVLAATRDRSATLSNQEVRRDYEATVVATTTIDGDKGLLVNGVGITSLTPITKVMAHLPLAFHEGPRRSVLVICFGMGTTFRSALSWEVATTAVDLVPSVPRLLGYYHADGPELLRSPLARVVIDDGRRFLERSPEQFDVITIDPPPPVEAAGSSLLYSREFYSVARSRLRPGGILQQWFPGGERAILSAVTRAIAASFPHVRVFYSLDRSGLHFLASESQIVEVPAAVLAGRLPPRAAADLVEWFPQKTPEQVFAWTLRHELVLERIILADPSAPILTDDRPFNEYYLLRRLRSGRRRPS